MSEVISLNKKRKAKARKEHEKKASRNRIKFGRTKEEKMIEEMKTTRAEKNLEGHKMETEEKE